MFTSFGRFIIVITAATGGSEREASGNEGDGCLHRKPKAGLEPAQFPTIALPLSYSGIRREIVVEKGTASWAQLPGCQQKRPATGGPLFDERFFHLRLIGR